MKSTAISWTLLLTILLSLLFSQSTPAQQEVAKVSKGNIEVKRAGKTFRLMPNESLLSGDVITVKRGDTAAVRCVSNQLELIVPDDDLPRGVSDFCS